MGLAPTRQGPSTPTRPSSQLVTKKTAPRTTHTHAHMYTHRHTRAHTPKGILLLELTQISGSPTLNITQHIGTLLSSVPQRERGAWPPEWGLPCMSISGSSAPPPSPSTKLSKANPASTQHLAELSAFLWRKGDGNLKPAHHLPT